MSETIDLTPTWEALLPVLIEVAANGETQEARRGAMDELRRMARAVDAMNASGKLATEKLRRLAEGGA